MFIIWLPFLWQGCLWKMCKILSFLPWFSGNLHHSSLTQFWAEFWLNENSWNIWNITQCNIPRGMKSVEANYHLLQVSHHFFQDLRSPPQLPYTAQRGPQNSTRGPSTFPFNAITHSTQIQFSKIIQFTGIKFNMRILEPFFWTLPVVQSCMIGSRDRTFVGQSDLFPFFLCYRWRYRLNRPCPVFLPCFSISTLISTDGMDSVEPDKKIWTRTGATNRLARQLNGYWLCENPSSSHPFSG